jgi:hypothetical protein
MSWRAVWWWSGLASVVYYLLSGCLDISPGVVGIMLMVVAVEA